MFAFVGTEDEWLRRANFTPIMGHNDREFSSIAYWFWFFLFFGSFHIMQIDTQCWTRARRVGGDVGPIPIATPYEKIRDKLIINFSISFLGRAHPLLAPFFKTTDNKWQERKSFEAFRDIKRRMSRDSRETILHRSFIPSSFLSILPYIRFLCPRKEIKMLMGPSRRGAAAGWSSTGEQRIPA